MPKAICADRPGGIEVLDWREIETPHLETIDINKKNKEQLLGIFFTQEEICGGYFNCSNGQKKIEAPSIPPFCIININKINKL